MNSKQQTANNKQQQRSQPLAACRLPLTLTIGIDATPATRAIKTGTERYCEALILEFARLKLPHQFVLYSRFAPSGALAKLPSNFTWKVMPFPFLWSQVRLAIEFLIHPSAVDVIFFPAHVMPLIHPKRSVITLHDIGFEHFPELYGTSPIGTNLPILKQLVSLGVRIVTLGRYGNSELDYHRWATRFALSRAARIITVSQAVKRDIQEHFRTSVSIEVIYHGVNAKRKAQSAKPTAKIKARQPYILFIGRLEAKKNVATLVRAFGGLAHRVPSRVISNEVRDPVLNGISQPTRRRSRNDHFERQINLVLIGRPGHGYADIADAIQALPDDARSRVHELGYVDNLSPWLANAELFAFPSAFEGFGLPPLEAMAAGVPVVAANGTSLPEVVGDAGLLVETYDVPAWAAALERTLTETKLRQSLITKGYAHVRTFTWAKSARAHLAVLESVGAKEF